MRRIFVAFAAFAIALMPLAANAASAEAQAAVDAVCTAVDGLGTAGDIDGWIAELAEVAVALELLREIGDPDLDLGEFDAAFDALEAAIQGGDLDEIAAAALLVDSACVDLAAAAAEEAPADEAPAGGVSTGGGGTAGSDVVPLVLLGLGASAAAVGVYTLRRRSQN